MDISPSPELASPPIFLPQPCAYGTPGLSLTLSFGAQHNSRTLVVSLVPNAATSDTFAFVITLAGTGLTFSASRMLNFVSPSGITGSADYNVSSLVLNVAINPSRSFAQNEPIIFAFGDLESVHSMAKHDIQSAAFSSIGTCLLQSNAGFCPTFSIFTRNLTQRVLKRCPGLAIDNNGIC